ncbi:MAG: SPFH domain-containing protein, partial [Clostridia bacterium]|nr:SPFH domain-containing protein [Clostridia bacterium]
MFGRVKRVSLDSVDMKNHDLFVKKSGTKLHKRAELIVDDTHSAILVKNGEMINTLSSGKYPIFDRDENPKDTVVDVIYMSKTAKLKTLWGTSQKMVIRDASTNEYVGVGASGEYEIQVSNPRKFYLEVIGVEKTYSIDDLKTRLLGRIVNEIEPIITSLIAEGKTTFDGITEYKRQIGDRVLEVLQERFERDYGI